MSAPVVTSMTKRELELEVARLRGQIEVLRDELRQARSARPVDVAPHIPTPQITPWMPDYSPAITWCGPTSGGQQ